jgi:hypothetical protein
VTASQTGQLKVQLMAPAAGLLAESHMVVPQEHKGRPASVGIRLPLRAGTLTDT